MDITIKYAKSHKIKKLSHDELCCLIKKYRKGDIASRNKIIEHNLGLVSRVARSWHGVQYDDAFQQGVIGLCSAIEHFDAGLGNMFSTYAVHWINNSIRRFYGKYSKIVRYKNQPENSILSLDCVRDDNEALQVGTYENYSDKIDAYEIINKLRNIDRKILMARAKGITLQEIGDEIGMTREGVRQLEERALNKIRRIIKKDLK